MAEADRTGWLVATPQGEAGRRIGRRKDDGEKRADRSICLKTLRRRTATVCRRYKSDIHYSCRWCRLHNDHRLGSFWSGEMATWRVHVPVLFLWTELPPNDLFCISLVGIHRQHQAGCCRLQVQHLAHGGCVTMHYYLPTFLQLLQ